MQTVFQYHAKLAQLNAERDDKLASAKTGQERRNIEHDYRDKAQTLHHEHDKLNR